jgi:hypothetical protein
MEVQTEIGGIKILKELNIHEISKDTASIIYVLTLGNGLNYFQQKHLEGNFDDFEINPKDALSVWGKKKLNDDFVSEMERDGLLENLAEEGYARYSITERGQEVLDLYCIGLKILSQELLARAGELFMQADAIQSSDSWKFDTGEIIEDIREAEEFEKQRENEKFMSEVEEIFERRKSKFNDVEKGRYHYHKFLINQIMAAFALKLKSDYDEENTEKLEESLLNSALGIEENEIKYLKDVLKMIRKDNITQPASIRLQGRDDEEFEILLEEAHKLGEIDEDVKETLEELRTEEEFEEIKDQLSWD